MQGTDRRRLARPSLSTTWGVLAWLMVPFAAVLALGPISEVDLYWHIRMGADILANGRLTGDPSWTFGPAADWQTTQAVPEVLLHWLFEAGGWAAVLVLRVLLGVAVTTSVILATAAVLRGRSQLVIDRAAGLVALVVTVALNGFIQERPQTVSLVILPWVGVLLLRVMYADRWPRWWVLGLVVMAWSWIHGAAILVAPLLVAAALIHALGVGGLSWLPVLVRSIRRGWAAIAAALVAPLIGPLGLGYYQQAARIQEAASSRIVEWQPPGANSAFVLLSLVLLGIWVMSLVRLAARSGSVWRTFRMDALLVAVLLLVMLSASRYTAIGILLLAPLVARRLGQAWVRPSVAVERLPRRVGLPLVVVAAAAAAVMTWSGAATVRPVAVDAPLQVWQALAADPQDRRVLVGYNLGGQAGLLGDVVVSIDGRADRYGAQGIDDYQDMTAGRPGWDETLAQYPGATDAVLPSDSGLVDRLEASGWAVVCVDGAYTWLTAPGVTGACPEEGDD
jgi:hypothetical protein